MIQAIENHQAQINAKKDKRGNCNSQNTFSNLLKNTVDNKNKTVKSADTEKTLQSKVPMQDVDDAAKNLTAPPQDGMTATIAMQMIPEVVLAGTLMDFSNPAKAADEIMKIQSAVSIDVQTQFNAAKYTASAQSEFAVQISQISMNTETEEMTLSSFQKQDEVQTSILSDVGIDAMQNSNIDFDVQIISDNTLMAKEPDKKPVQELNIEIQKNADAEMKKTLMEASEKAAENPPSDKKDSEIENTDMSLLQNSVEKFALKTIKISDGASEVKQPVIHQIAEKVLVNLKNDVSEFKMQLHPKDLGEISVRMITKNGVLTVELLAANSKTQDLLNANADKIRAVLESSQQKDVNINYTKQDHETYANLQEHSCESGRQQHEQPNQPSQKDDEKFIMTDNFLSFLEMMEQKAV